MGDDGRYVILLWKDADLVDESHFPTVMAAVQELRTSLADPQDRFPYVTNITATEAGEEEAEDEAAPDAL